MPRRRGRSPAAYINNQDEESNPYAGLGSGKNLRKQTSRNIRDSLPSSRGGRGYGSNNQRGARSRRNEEVNNIDEHSYESNGSRRSPRSHHSNSRRFRSGESPKNFSNQRSPQYSSPTNRYSNQELEYDSYEDGQQMLFDEDGNPIEMMEEPELLRTEPEMEEMLHGFNEMRLDCNLCDIKFSVQGVTFFAHRVILCSSSRWFKSLLSDGARGKHQDSHRVSIWKGGQGETYNSSKSNIINLDDLDPEAFEFVLGYIYGEKIELEMENGVEFMKCVQLFELHDLEKKYWTFLGYKLDEKNCLYVHHIADLYENEEIKRKAWDVIKDTIPDYNISPYKMTNPDDYIALDDGFEKVVKRSFRRKKRRFQMLARKGMQDFYEDSDEENGPEEGDEDDVYVMEPQNYDENGNLIEETPENPFEDEEEEEKEDESSNIGSEKASNEERMNKVEINAGQGYKVVHQWLARLQKAYDACVPPPEEEELQFDEGELYDNQQEEGNYEYRNDLQRSSRSPLSPGRSVRQMRDSQSYDGSIQGNRSRGSARLTQQHSAQQGRGRGRGRGEAFSTGRGSGRGRGMMAQTGGGTKDYRALVTAFYKKHNPSKLSDVDTILTKYRGKEELLLKSLQEKYGSA